MSIGWLGLDADSWGNVIAAATGASAILGGAYTVSRTARLNREARAEERAADREAELRAQSREALGRVIEAADEYADLMWAAPRDERDPADADAERHTQLNEIVGRITTASAFVHEKATRKTLLLALRAYSLVFWKYKGRARTIVAESAERERVIRRAGELAAAYLREDVEAQEALTKMITNIYNRLAAERLEANRGAHE